jgi:hypothetical protein
MDTVRSLEELLEAFGDDARPVTKQEMRDLIVSIWSFFTGAGTYDPTLRVKGDNTNPFLELVRQDGAEAVSVNAAGKLKTTPRSTSTTEKEALGVDLISSVPTPLYTIDAGTVPKVSGAKIGGIRFAAVFPVAVLEAVGLEAPPAPVAGNNVTIDDGRSYSARFPGAIKVAGVIQLTVLGSQPLGNPPADSCWIYAYNDSGTHKLVVENSAGNQDLLATLS